MAIGFILQRNQEGARVKEVYLTGVPDAERYSSELLITRAENDLLEKGNVLYVNIRDDSSFIPPEVKVVGYRKYLEDYARLLHDNKTALIEEENTVRSVLEDLTVDG